LLPTGAGATLLLDTAGNEVLFGEGGSLLRFRPEDLSGTSLLGVGNAIPQQTRGYTISGAVAPGEIVSLYGTALGPQAGVGAQLDNTGKVATMLAGTQILFDGFPAPLLYVGANQINAVVPFEVSDRPASMLEVHTSASSSRASIRVIAADPALPAVFDQNFGPYISLVLNQDGSINSLANRAAPGEIVTFWVNGAGRFRQPLATGAIIGPERVAPVLPVTVGVNDLPAEVLYAATAPGMIAGMMQVNARIPREAPPGSYSAMQIHVGDFLVFGSVAVK
jgi:uncharacterized protein (TIGR03437 family)